MKGIFGREFLLFQDNFVMFLKDFGTV